MEAIAFVFGMRWNSLLISIDLLMASTCVVFPHTLVPYAITIDIHLVLTDGGSEFIIVDAGVQQSCIYSVPYQTWE